MENNEYEIVEKTNKKGMTISKGDKSIEMSPEVSMQICTQMATLGTQLISEVGHNCRLFQNTSNNVLWRTEYLYQKSNFEERRKKNYFRAI